VTGPAQQGSFEATPQGTRHYGRPAQIGNAGRVRPFRRFAEAAKALQECRRLCPSGWARRRSRGWRLRHRANPPRSVRLSIALQGPGLPGSGIVKKRVSKASRGGPNPKDCFPAERLARRRDHERRLGVELTHCLPAQRMAAHGAFLPLIPRRRAARIAICRLSNVAADRSSARRFVRD
jgi:hypothetical protein